jgi:hypothetical protein
MQLVDEEDDVAPLADLLHDLLQTLLEFAAVLRAGYQGGQIEGVDLLVLEQLGHVAGGDALGQALDHRRLAHAGLTDQNRVVFGAAREDLHHALDLGLAPDHRVELAVGGQPRQVAPELVEQLGALRPLAARRARSRALLAAPGAREHADDLIANLLGVSVEIEQDARRHALVLTHQPKQDVLGTDVVMTERERLSQRQFQHFLGARREGDLTGRDLVALADDARHLRPDLLDGDVERLEHARGKALLLAQEPEQDVLGTDVVVLESTSLVLRKYDYLPGPLGKSLEQPSRPLFSVDLFRISAVWLRSNRILAEGHLLKTEPL